MRTGSALLHRWSAALEEYDFTVRHRPGKVQTHVDGLSRLPVGPAPPEHALLHVQVDSEEEARRLAQELHTATHLGGQALWKLFSDRYSHKAGRRICIEVAQSCPQCQRGSDYGHRLKTTGTIQSKGPWDTLSVDIVGPLPADRRHEFVIVFVDCFSRYSILVPASNHTASMVSDALLQHVVPYFGTPRRLLSDRGQEFVGEVWASLTLSLGIQMLLTSPYHPEGNSINEWSHRTINNMLRARLLEGVPSRNWVDKIPGIMLALNAMVHEPHGFSASMIATGREPTLPPDLEGDACASPSLEDPASYVEAVRQRLTLTHQQMTPPPAPVATNPYHEGSLIFVMTTPPERSNKLAPRWKGPFFVKRVPNPYQVPYEDGLVWRTIHVNHAKPAKTPADGFQAPLPTPEPPQPPLGYLPRSLQRPRPRQPLLLPQSAAATPPSSRPTTRSTANRNLASRSGPRPPAAPGRAHENLRPGQPLRRSARLTPRACAVNSHPQPAAPQLLKYGQCLGHEKDPYSFCSLFLEDLHSGRKEYLGDIQQLVDALPRSLDPGSRLSLTAQVTPPGQKRLPHSMRASLWWLLPSDGEFQSAPSGTQYYLARQGRCVVLRGGDIKVPFHKSRLNWIHDPTPPPSCRLESTNAVPRSDSSYNSRVSIPRNALAHIPSASLHNSSVSVSGAPRPNNSVRSYSKHVPERKKSENKISAIATRGPPAAPPSPAPPKKCRIRRRRQAKRAANRNSGINSAAPLTPDARWANQRAAGQTGATQTQPEGSDPTSTKRTAVYPPSRIVGGSLTNENSPFQMGLESSRIPGLYKPAVPDHQEDTQAGTLRVKNSGSGTSSPPYLLPYTKPFSGRPSGSYMTGPTREAGEALRSGSGIVYPLLPRAHRPDTSVTVDAALPEPAAFQRQNQPPTVVEIGSPIQPQTSPAARRRASRKPSRKRRRNRSTAVFRPAKRPPSRGHWCD